MLKKYFRKFLYLFTREKILEESLGFYRVRDHLKNLEAGILTDINSWNSGKHIKQSKISPSDAWESIISIYPEPCPSIYFDATHQVYLRREFETHHLHIKIGLYLEEYKTKAEPISTIRLNYSIKK